jgi:hypothetical protein
MSDEMRIQELESAVRVMREQLEAVGEFIGAPLSSPPPGVCSVCGGRGAVLVGSNQPPAAIYVGAALAPRVVPCPGTGWGGTRPQALRAVFP